MKTALVVVLLLLTPSAYAADAARAIDFTAVLTDQDGITVMDCIKPDKEDPKKCAEETPFTLGRAAMRALTAKWPDEQNLDGKEQYARADLGMRVYKSNAVTLTADDVALLKKLIAKAFGPIVVFRSWQMLDPAVSK